jgi:hypothetical protein
MIEGKERSPYFDCLIKLTAITVLMPDVIFRLFDTMPTKLRYPLSYSLDAFKGMDLFKQGEGTFDPIQCGMLARQITEQSAIAIVLFDHQELLDKFVAFYKEREKIYSLKDDAKKEALTSFLAKDGISKGKLHDYLDYGWLRGFDGNKNYGLDKLFKMADLHDFEKWREEYNRFTHLVFTTCSLLGGDDSEALKLMEELAYNVACVFDVLTGSFHNATGFDFVFDGVDLRKPFRDSLETLTEIKRARQASKKE